MAIGEILVPVPSKKCNCVVLEHLILTCNKSHADLGRLVAGLNSGSRSSFPRLAKISMETQISSLQSFSVVGFHSAKGTLLRSPLLTGRCPPLKQRISPTELPSGLHALGNS